MDVSQISLAGKKHKGPKIRQKTAMFRKQACSVEQEGEELVWKLFPLMPGKAPQPWKPMEQVVHLFSESQMQGFLSVF